MDISQLELNYLLIIITCLIAVLCGVALVAVLFLLRKNTALKKEHEALVRDFAEKLDKLIEKTAQDVTQSLADNTTRAKDIVSKTELVSEEMKKQFLADFSLLKDEERKVFKDLLKQNTEIAIKDINNISKDIEIDIKTTSDVLKQKLSDDESQLRMKVEKAALAYKEELYNKIKQNFFNYFSELTRSVLHKTLTPIDDQDLIIQSIEEAKKRHVF